MATVNTTEQKITITGIHTFRRYDMRSLKAKILDQKIKFHIAARRLWGHEQHRARFLELLNQLQQFKTGEMIVKNLVTTAGRSVLAQRLANITTYTGIINYGALGTSSTAVNNADTQLGAEVFRKVVASTSYTTNTGYIDFYYSKADTNGTYQEFGTFIDGTGSANSGQLFTHALTGGWTKSSSESMTVSTQYTLS